MKKKAFTLLLALVAIATTARAQVVLNETNFPDANFRAALATWLGISEGDEITAEKIAATTMLRVPSKKIADLTGIEHFTALTSLSCGGNRLTSLDVSGCTALTELYCSRNQLTSLDVSQNTALTDLFCYYNQLTALDVSNNTALTSLVCYSNQIKGEAMDALVASLRTVVSGDFFVIDTKDENEGNVCRKTQVAVAKEKGWWVYDNNGGSGQKYEGSDDATAKLLLNAENFPDANFRKALASILKISEGDEITEAKIAARTVLDVSGKSIADLTGIEHFTALKYLNCGYNQLTSLDVSKNTALTELWCDNNQLTALDVAKNTALTELYCSRNQLTSLDVSQNTALTDLFCYYNQLTALDVSKNTELTLLLCDYNQLTALDVSKNTALVYLSCINNQIKGKEMDALVASLPTVESSNFYVIDTKNENEGNVCTKAQVAVAKGKGWTVYDNNGGSKQEYEGSDNTTAIDASLNDNGKMINDNYYSIDGVKLSGEQTKMGIYIYNGKKVKK